MSPADAQLANAKRANELLAERLAKRAAELAYQATPEYAAEVEAQRLADAARRLDANRRLWLTPEWRAHQDACLADALALKATLAARRAKADKAARTAALRTVTTNLRTAR